jgi:type 1 glutamine amidotransferase
MGNDRDLLVAVVTGHHPYDVIGFTRAFRSIEGAECFIMNMEDWNLAPKAVRQGYDVVVFYNMHMKLPPAESPPGLESGIRGMIDDLGETAQGIIVLHHAILAYPDSEAWTEMVGIKDPGFGYYLDQTVTYDIADPSHPITAGMSSWTMPDETYTMTNAGEGCHVILITEHEPSMRTIAWTRHYRNSRVLCFQCGHDNGAYSNASFREVLARGVRWCAGRL